MSGNGAPRTIELSHGIVAVDTDYVRPMLDASHLIVENGRAAFVDTGTNDSVPLLLAALAQANLDPGDVDFVFLTHVHLDHAGGAGLLLEALPNAVAVIHPRGARHMIDPEKLTRGSIAVYGEDNFRRLYGELKPIPEARVTIASDGDEYSLAGRTLTALHTEGHARHHYCLHDPASSGVFTGDSFGISLREFDTDAGEFVYPTTTPVHFDPPEAHKAIDRICALGPTNLYLTHYSRVTGVERLGAAMHRRIDDFVALTEAAASATDRQASIAAALADYLTRELRDHGVTLPDPALQELIAMDLRLNAMGLVHWLDQRPASPAH